MKLGLNTSILGHMSFEELIPFVAQIGYQCIEVACWPIGKADRRYAGVSHIDVTNLNEDVINTIHSLCNKHGIEISALAFYPNVLDGDINVRNNAIKHLYNVIDAANTLDVNMVTTFIGRDQTLNIDENFASFKETWTPIINYAETKGVKIAIENCPMWFSNDEWPGGKNLFTSPSNWRRAFELINSEYFGINYDPSHFVWQMIDYIKPLYTFKDKIFHVHFKDIKLYQDRLNDVGIMANPLEYMSPKLPGLGDVNWGQYISALNDIDFKGFACVEVEDRSFEENIQDIEDSCSLSYRYLSQYLR